MPDCVLCAVGGVCVRRRPRVDANQSDIVEFLREAGASVQSLAGVACGVPDLLVGYKGMTLLFEVKDGMKPHSKRRLTPDQEAWVDGWRGGAVWLVTDRTTAKEALESYD